MGVYDAQIEDTLKKRGDCCILFVWMFFNRFIEHSSTLIKREKPFFFIFVLDDDNQDD